MRSAVRKTELLVLFLTAFWIFRVTGASMAQSPLLLIPKPQFVQHTETAFVLKAGVRVLTDDRQAQATLDLMEALSAHRWKPALAVHPAQFPTGSILLTTVSARWSRSIWDAGKEGAESRGCDHPEGYTLRVDPQGIRIIGHDAAGLFYGVQTLLQCLEALPADAQTLPGLHIEDWPDMPIRAMHLCLFRYADRKPNMTYMRAWLGRVAPRAKLNTVIIQVDDLLQYRTHPEMSRPTALTQAEMRALIDYGKRRHLTLIPHLQCLSHQDSLFGYAHPDTLAAPNSGTYNPLDSRILPILTDLLGELRAVFKNDLIHLGFDEVDEQALRRAPATKDTSPIDLFLNHLNTLSERTRRLGMRPMIWPDMLLRWAKQNKSSPSLLSRVPKEVVFCDWQYRADVDAAALETCLRSGHEVWATGSAKYQEMNLPRLAYAAHKHGIRALIGSTWNSFGPMRILQENKSVSSLIAAGEYAWSVPPSAEAPLRLDAVAITRSLLQDTAPP